MRNSLVLLLGWRALILHGDPTVYDRYRWLKEVLEPGQRRSLDAGCGSGGFSFFSASIGNEVVAISYSDEEISIARQRAGLLDSSESVRFIREDLTELERFGKDLGTFHQIICLETIEHIEKDWKFLKDLRNLLQPGGQLALTTPYKNHRAFYGENLGGLHHRWGYTHDEMRKMFEEADLTVVSESYLSGFISQKLASLTFRLSRLNSTLAWFVVLPLRLLTIFDRPITRVLRYPYLSIAIVGKLKRLDGSG